MATTSYAFCAVAMWTIRDVPMAAALNRGMSKDGEKKETNSLRGSQIVMRLSALRAGRALRPRNIPETYFC
jgi:hypothetical protein